MICNAIFFAIIYKLLWRKAFAKRLSKMGLRPTMVGTVIAYGLFIVLVCLATFGPYFYAKLSGNMSGFMIPIAAFAGLVFAWMFSVRVPIGEPILSEKGQTKNLFGSGSGLVK